MADIARLGIEVDTSDLRGAEKDLDRFSRAGRRAEDSVDELGGVASRAAVPVARLGTSVRGAVGGLVAAAGGFAAVRDTLNRAETYTGLTNQLQAMGLSADEAATRLAEIAEVAQRSRAPIEGTAKLYSRLSVAAGEIGASSQDVLKFTETVGKALSSAGVSSNEASGALLQLSQAMAGGVVRAEEFNSILEGAFPIALAAARGIDEAGGSVGRLRQLVVDGQISSEEFFNAILSQSEAIEEGFANTAVTVGQATTQLGNSLTLLVGRLDGEGGLTGSLAEAIQGLSGFIDGIAELDNLPQIAGALGVVATAALAMVAPFTVAGALIAGAAITIYRNWDELSRRYPALTSAITAAAGVAGDVLGRVGRTIRIVAEGGVEALDATISAIGALIQGDFATAAQDVRRVGAAVARVFVDAAREWGIDLEAAFGSFVETVTGWRDAAVQLGRDLIEWFITAFKELPLKLKGLAEDAWEAFVGGFQGAQVTGAEGEIRFAGDRVAADLSEGFTSGLLGRQNDLEIAAQKTMLAVQQAMRAGAREGGLEVGAFVISGLVEGLKNNLARAAEAAADVMQAVIARAKSVAGIQSPSKVFREIGGDTVEGFALGIDAGTAEAVEAIRGVIEETIGEANSLASGLTDVVFDGLLTGAEDTFERIGDLFKNLLIDMARQAFQRQIQIGVNLSAGGGGGVAQVAGGGGGFGGILGQIGGIGSAFAGGAGSVVSGFLSGGFGGAFGAIGSAISGITTGAGALTSIAAAAGAVALPLAAVAAVIGLLKKRTEVLQTGIEAVVPTLDNLVDENGNLRDSLDFTVRAFERVKTSNAVSADISKNFSDAGDAAGEMNEAFRQLYVSTFAATEALGISADIYLDYFRDFAGAVAQFDFKGKDAAGVQAEITRRLADHIDYVIRYGAETDANTARLVDALDRTAVAGETTYDTLVRIANQFEVVSTTLEVLGLRSVGIGVAGAEAADAFVKLFGGLEGFVGALNTYTERFYSEAEQAALITRNLTDQLAAYNVAVPASRAQLRALVDAQDLTTDKGRELAAVLIQNADAFDRILPAASALTATLQDAFGAARETVSSEISALQQLSRDTLASAQLWYRTAQSLRDFIRDLDGTDLGGRTSAQQFASNSAAFNAAVAGAQAGDVEAARSIPALGRALIESARETAQTRADFQFVAARVRSETELAAGIANLTGARDEVLADLYRQSVDVLTAIDTWLSLEGATDEQIAALGDDVKALFRDYAGTLKGFEGDLSALQAAIKDLSSFTYADLQGEIDAVIRIAARADDLPPGLRAIIQDDAREIRATVDFILRNNELTPDLLFLAINPLRESVKTLRFLARSELPPDLIRVALTETEAIRKTVNFVVGADGLDAQAKALALAASSELQRAVTAILRSDQSDPRALRLALGNVGAYRVNVDAALQPGVPDGIRRLVLSQTPTYTAGIVAVVQSDQLSEPARRALLTQQGDYIVSISQVLTDRLSDRKRDLILEAATTGFRFLSLRALDNDLTPRQRALLFDDEPEVRATIRAALDGTRLDGDARRFLRSFTSGADDVTKRIVGRANLGTDEDKLRLVDRLLGAADGNIVLNGGITFDPQASFSAAARGVISGAFSTTATRLALVREALIDVRKSIRDEIPNLADKIVKLRDKVADLDKTLSDPIPTTPVDENTVATPKTIVDAFKLIFQGIGDPTGVIDPTARGTFHTGGIVGERRVTALEGEGIFTPGQMAALAPAPNMDALVVEMRELRKEVERLRRENGSGQAVIASRLKYPDEKAQRDLAGVS